MMNQSQAQRFAALFRGYDSAFGTYDLTHAEADERGKLKGQARTVHEQMTPRHWQAHIDGECSLGVIPIDRQNRAQWGAIDVDTYNLTPIDVVKLVSRYKLPLLVARSKSGGIHLFLFASEPVSASILVARLKQLAALLGFAGSEIFPKQVAVHWDRGDVGSWINLPYFGEVRGNRYAFAADADATPLGLDDFLNLAESLRQPPLWFTQPITTPPDEMPEGPPCLQHLVQIGFPAGTRNQGLFNLAVYARKANPDDWEEHVVQMNARNLKPALSLSEVQSVIKSVGRKDYGYRCSDQPISAHCNKDVCRSRRFGIGAGGADQLRIENLRKLATNPPLFFASIQGAVLELNGEQLQDPRKVQLACINSLNSCPALPKRDSWAAHLSSMLSTCEVIPAPDDASDEGRLWSFVEGYCTRQRAMDRDEMLLGRPWTDSGRTYFLAESLLSFLERKRCKIPANRVWSVVRRNGGEYRRGLRIKGKSVALWCVPEFSEQSEAFDVPEKIEKGSETPSF